MNSPSVKPPLVALITGARRGIGRHLVEHLLAQGFLVAGASRHPSDLRHAHYCDFPTDVSDEPAVLGLMEQVRQHAGGVDVLINAAGAASMNLALLTPAVSLGQQIAANFTGTFLLCREAAKLMIPRRKGRIVNFTSVAVPLRLEGEAAYASSKAAVETFTRVFAREVAPHGITVNAIGPGPVETDLLRGIGAEARQALLQRLPLGRLSTREEVAHVVDFLIAPASAAITGQVLYLGGAG